MAASVLSGMNMIAAFRTTKCVPLPSLNPVRSRILAGRSRPRCRLPCVSVRASSYLFFHRSVVGGFRVAVPTSQYLLTNDTPIVCFQGASWTCF